MFKLLTVIMGAAAVAAIITVASAPIADVVASPLPEPAAATASCPQRPWPYVNCVSTEFGNPRVRLIAIDRPAQ